MEHVRELRRSVQFSMLTLTGLQGTAETTVQAWKSGLPRLPLASLTLTDRRQARPAVQTGPLLCPALFAHVHGGAGNNTAPLPGPEGFLHLIIVIFVAMKSTSPLQVLGCTALTNLAQKLIARSAPCRLTTSLLA
jgi:hypothetical protein